MYNCKSNPPKMPCAVSKKRLAIPRGTSLPIPIPRNSYNQKSLVHSEHLFSFGFDISFIISCPIRLSISPCYTH